MPQMRTTKYGKKTRKMSLRARFIAETVVLWLLFCLPINLLTLYLQKMAPEYSHNITSSSDWAQVAQSSTQSVYPESADYDYADFERQSSGTCI